MKDLPCSDMDLNQSLGTNRVGLENGASRSTSIITFFKKRKRKKTNRGAATKAAPSLWGLSEDLNATGTTVHAAPFVHVNVGR